MGTRSSIIVKQSKTIKTPNGPIKTARFYRFYKHWDGYPTGNLTLIHKFIALSQNVNKSVKSLMSLASILDHQKSEYEGCKMSHTEIVSHNEHGDLEWTYFIDLDHMDVKIFESQDGTSSAQLYNKCTDPLEYINKLIESARANEKYQIETAANSIKALGFKINGAA